MPFSDRRVRVGDWDLKPIAPLKRLSTLTAGIVGMGRIGRMIAAKLEPFGFRIVFHDPLCTGEPPVPAARAVGLGKLFARQPRSVGTRAVEATRVKSTSRDTPAVSDLPTPRP